ncbi:MAG: Rrf2 family transcriptional regulator [Bacteroidales bacterium]|jgi:Rrf2 family protein|nr:Rrf2 family transcriptional regulator [Bacteroidales bacterium]
MFSKACKYAIRALIYLASRSEEPEKTGLREIAAEIDSPEAFTAKIMQILSKQNLVKSAKGPHGGFYIDPQTPEIKLIEVVKAIDGTHSIYGCGLGLKSCSETEPCPIHHEFSAIRNGLARLLNEQTIQQLAREMMEGKSVLKHQLN